MTNLELVKLLTYHLCNIWDISSYGVHLKYKKSRFEELSNLENKEAILTAMILEGANNVRLVCSGESYPITAETLQNNLPLIDKALLADAMDEDCSFDDFGSLDFVQMLVFGELIVG